MSIEKFEKQHILSIANNFGIDGQQTWNNVLKGESFITGDLCFYRKNEEDIYCNGLLPHARKKFNCKFVSPLVLVGNWFISIKVGNEPDLGKTTISIMNIYRAIYGDSIVNNIKLPI